MGCEQSNLSGLSLSITVCIIDPAYLKSSNEAIRKSLQSHHIQTKVYMSVQCFIEEQSSNYSNNILVREPDLQAILTQLKRIGMNPNIYVIDNGKEQFTHPKVTYIKGYQELIDRIEDKKQSLAKKQQKNGGSEIDLKILKSFKGQVDSQLFIFEQTLKIKKISYQIFSSFGDLEASMDIKCKFILTDYRFHKEAISITDPKKVKVICFCQLSEKQSYDPKVYFITNNFQEVTNEIATFKMFKIPPLPTTKIFMYSINEKFFRFAEIFEEFNLQPRIFQSLTELLRSARLYFSFVLVCPEQLKDTVQKKLQEQSTVFRAKVLYIQQQTECSAVGLRKQLREVKRGYIVQKKITRYVDIIDKYHNSAKFQQIKKELSKNDIGFKCYNDMTSYIKTLTFVSPYIICNFNERNLLARYLEQIQSRCKIIIFCNKAKINDQLLNDDKWSFISSNFGKIIKYFKNNLVLVPVILDQNHQKIQLKQQKIKNKQHRISALKWAEGGSSLLLKQPELSFIITNKEATQQSLKEVSQDACCLLKIQSPLKDMAKFRKKLIQSLKYLKDLYKVSYPEVAFNELLAVVNHMSLHTLGRRVRQFLGDQKDMGLGINNSLKTLEKLKPEQLSHLKQIFFLMNLNFMSFYKFPALQRKVLTHWTKDTPLAQCHAGSTLICKNFLVMHQEGSTQAVPDCIKLQIQLQSNTLTNNDPQLNSFFMFNGRYVFAPYCHLKVKQIEKQNKITVVHLELVKQTDFLNFFFEETLSKDLFGLFESQSQKQSLLIDSNEKQAVAMNCKRLTILKYYRLGKFDNSIKLQKQLIKQQEQSENFDSQSLNQLQYQLANYLHGKGSQTDDLLSIINEIIQSSPSEMIKQNCLHLLEKIEKTIDKTSVTPQQKSTRTLKCIELKEQIKNDGESQSQKDSAQQNEGNLMQQKYYKNILQCIQIDEREGFGEHFH